MNDQMSKNSRDRTEHCVPGTVDAARLFSTNNPACAESASYSQKSFSEGSQDPQKGGRKKTENHWELA